MASARIEQIVLVILIPNVIMNPGLTLNRNIVTVLCPLSTKLEWMDEILRPKSMVVTIYRRIITMIIAFLIDRDLVIAVSFNLA